MHGQWLHDALDSSLLRFEPLFFFNGCQRSAALISDYLIFSFCRFIFVENPQIGDDARIEELIGRHLNDGLDPIVVEKISADIASPTGVAAEQRRAVVYFYDNTFIFVQMPSVMLQEEQLPVAHRGGERELACFGRSESLSHSLSTEFHKEGWLQRRQTLYPFERQRG